MTRLSCPTQSDVPREIQVQDENLTATSGHVKVRRNSFEKSFCQRTPGEPGPPGVADIIIPFHVAPWACECELRAFGK
jgi:hypothetical protein